MSVRARLKRLEDEANKGVISDYERQLKAHRLMCSLSIIYGDGASMTFAEFLEWGGADRVAAEAEAALDRAYGEKEE